MSVSNLLADEQSIERGGRYPALDGLRGIAACIVVLSHIALTLDLQSRIERTVVLAPLIAGSSAVYVFFVLSGFVLFLAYVGHDDSRPGIFMVKRIVRIYPPVAVTVLVAACLVLVLKPVALDGLSVWFNGEWLQPVSWRALAEHLLLSDRTLWLDWPLWSLVVEFRISLVFPILVFFVRRMPVLAVLGSFLLSFVCRHYGGLVGGSTIDLMATGQYLFLFVAGAVIASRIKDLRAFVEDLDKPTSYALLIGAIALTSLSPSYNGSIPTQFGAVGMVGMIALVPHLSAVFSRPIFLALGKMSYSLYLIHMVVLLAICHGFATAWAPQVSVVLALPMVLIVSAAMYRYIERPSILASREVGIWARARGLAAR